MLALSLDYATLKVSIERGWQMPNWVYNNLIITGERKDLVAFRDKAARLAPNGISEDGVLEYSDGDIQALSFWNFKEPENKHAYFSSSSGTKPEGYEGWSSEEKLAHDLKFSGDGWYDWNVREWGCKWDAGDVSFEDNSQDKEQQLHYNFSTPWSVAEGAFVEMVAQHPELEFQFYAEEEQGWGIEAVGQSGEFSLTKEWDIPDSHAAYVALDREENCNCGDGDDDQEYWFEDCPRPSQTFAVVVEQTFYVKAADAEKAWELAGEKLAGVVLDLGEEITQADENSMFVRDIDTNQRLFPVA
jgi:hypothetical protein